MKKVHPSFCPRPGVLFMFVSMLVVTILTWLWLGVWGVKEERDHQPQQGYGHHQLEQRVAIPPGQHRHWLSSVLCPVSQHTHGTSYDYSRLLKQKGATVKSSDTCSLVYWMIIMSLCQIRITLGSVLLYYYIFDLSTMALSWLEIRRKVKPHPTV